MEITYTCPTCKATKTFKQPDHMGYDQFLQRLPKDVPCGVGGCKGRSIRLGTKIPVVDIKRKEIGTLELSQETVEIAKATGLDLIMRYNIRTKEVTAWLE